MAMSPLLPLTKPNSSLKPLPLTPPWTIPALFLLPPPPSASASLQSKANEGGLGTQPFFSLELVVAAVVLAGNWPDLLVVRSPPKDILFR